MTESLKDRCKRLADAYAASTAPDAECGRTELHAAIDELAARAPSGIPQAWRIGHPDHIELLPNGALAEDSRGRVFTILRRRIFIDGKPRRSGFSIQQDGDSGTGEGS